MAVYHNSAAVRAATTIALIAGIWTIVSPYALVGNVAAEWNGWVFGILIILCAFGAMMAPLSRGYDVANIIWGIWLVISGWALSTIGLGLRWSNVITGIVVIVCSWVAMRYVARITTLPETGYDNTRRAA